MVDVIAPGSSKIAKNAMDAVLKPTVKQSLEIASGVRDDYDFARMGWDFAKRFGTSLIKAPGQYTSYLGINKMIGNLPCNIARGRIKYAEEILVSLFEQ